jgi:hypothetical protein
MTIGAQRNAVTDVVPKLWELGKGLQVMGMQATLVSTHVTALSAGVVVSALNPPRPLKAVGSTPRRSLSVLPHRMRRACQGWMASQLLRQQSLCRFAPHLASIRQSDPSLVYGALDRPSLVVAFDVAQGNAPNPSECCAAPLWHPRHLAAAAQAKRKSYLIGSVRRFRSHLLALHWPAWLGVERCDQHRLGSVYFTATGAVE